jgi:hypothetical protein
MLSFRDRTLSDLTALARLYVMKDIIEVAVPNGADVGLKAKRFAV